MFYISETNIQNESYSLKSEVSTLKSELQSLNSEVWCLKSECPFQTFILSRMQMFSMETWCGGLPWRWRCWDSSDQVEILWLVFCCQGSECLGSLSNVCTITCHCMPTPNQCNYSSLGPICMISCFLSSFSVITIFVWWWSVHTSLTLWLTGLLHEKLSYLSVWVGLLYGYLSDPSSSGSQQVPVTLPLLVHFISGSRVFKCSENSSCAWTEYETLCGCCSHTCTTSVWEGGVLPWIFPPHHPSKRWVK